MKILGLIYVGTIDVPATKNGDVANSTKTFPLGGGDWSIEVYDIDGNFLTEFVGSNGTRDEATDLWREFDEWCNEIVTSAYKVKQYKSPDGSIGTYSYFKREIFKGNLHGLIATF